MIKPIHEPSIRMVKINIITNICTPFVMIAVCHAEYNAIINKGAADITGSDVVLYVTRYPCLDCALFIIHSGIKKFVYIDKGYDKTRDKEAEEVLKAKLGVAGQ